MPWLDNPTFEDPIEPTWFSNITGDTSDVNATTSPGQVNFEILGEPGIFNNVSGIPKWGDGWRPFNNSYFIPPDFSEINDNYGCNAYHTYDETVDQSRNRPSIHWRRNITMPVDMSDYNITSVSLNAIVNGSADMNLETPNDSFSGTHTYWDHAIFYVKVSNLDYNNTYQLASYKATDLGEGDPPGTSYLNDTYMIVEDEEDLIFYLTRALEKDPYHFGITLGIDIFCEDNYPFADLDEFFSLIIKSVNLTFNYEKKMDQLTSISWSQVGNMINGTNVQITEANLEFNYKINELWPEIPAPNSEIRIFINNIQHTETVKLSLATTSFQAAKVGGYDLTDITPPYENITLSIQVILEDEFGLNRTLVLSIDDVYLEISYTETFPDPQPIPEPFIFRILLIIASIASLCLGGYLIAYQRVFKYPKPVRKVRKFRRTLRRKNAPSKEITNREKAFTKAYKEETSDTSKYLKGKTTEELSKKKIITKSPKTAPEDLSDLSDDTTKKEGGIS